MSVKVHVVAMFDLVSKTTSTVQTVATCRLDLVSKTFSKVQDVAMLDLD